MLKRQDSSLSNSSRRQAAALTPPPPSQSGHAKAIGCMSGIFQLFSKYQNTKKRLTFGRKSGKWKPPSPTESLTQEEDEKQKFETIPPDIIRSDGFSSPEEFPKPSSLVARLMGLEGVGGGTEKRPDMDEDSVTEQKQQLMQALEKCNEDLEALKRIIKALQAGDVRLPPPRAAVEDGRAVEGGGGVNSMEEEVCVKECTDVIAVTVDKPAGEAAEYAAAVHDGTTADYDNEGIPQPCKPTTTKKPREDETIIRLLNKYSIESSLLLMRRRVVAPPWTSRAMVESVEEVCADVAWGQKREMGRIGLVLQDHLWRLLIEEIVQELNKSNYVPYSLPLEACKKRLSFY